MGVRDVWAFYSHIIHGGLPHLPDCQCRAWRTNGKWLEASNCLHIKYSLADGVFIRLFGVSVFGIHSPFGFQRSFFSFSLSCVFAHSCKHRLTCYSWRRKLKTLLFFHVRALRCFYLKWSQYKRNRVNCPPSNPTRTRSKRAQKSSVLLKFFRYGKTQRIHKQGKKRLQMNASKQPSPLFAHLNPLLTVRLKGVCKASQICLHECTCMFA